MVEIIGEAASRVSKPRRAEHPAIDGGQIIGMRNRLIYGYDAIHYDMVWKTVVEDIPPLIAALEPIVAVLDTAPPQPSA